MASTKRMAAKPWVKGQSGNPKGRTPGQSNITKWREAMAADVPEILAGLIAQAKAGDVMAARLILERAIPALKNAEATQAIDLPAGTLTEQGMAVLEAVASGALAPGQGSQLISAIGTLARVTEIDELTARIAKLEAEHEAKS